jgi:cbb3-type cytochrome oxidase maturation protein
MSAIFLLIGFSLVVALGFLAAFLWSVRNGQFDDQETPAHRVLFEDDIKPENQQEH